MTAHTWDNCCLFLEQFFLDMANQMSSSQGVAANLVIWQVAHPIQGAISAGIKLNVSEELGGNGGQA